MIGRVLAETFLGFVPTRLPRQTGDNENEQYTHERARLQVTPRTTKVLAFSKVSKQSANGKVACRMHILLYDALTKCATWLMTPPPAATAAPMRVDAEASSRNCNQATSRRQCYELEGYGSTTR